MAQRCKVRKLLKRARHVVAVVTVIFASPASAQLLPLGGRLLSLPADGLLRTIPSTINRTTQGVDRTLKSTLHATDNTLRDIVGRPRAHNNAIETIDGRQIVRGEVLVISPDERNLALARNLGFTLVRTENLRSLGLSEGVLRAPDGMDTKAALAKLRNADPTGNYDYNHIYNPSGDKDTQSPSTSIVSGASGVAAVGMIDAGIDHNHPALNKATIRSKCFAGNKPGPATAHGTAVASLLVGESGDFHGFLPGTILYAADVYCGQLAGGSAEDIVRALAWLARKKIAVVNISLSGPPNALLAAATAAFIRRGHVLVAAVGNDGPAAPEKYPAAYPGVVGVTSVNAKDQIQLDANRGSDVAFAARGVDIRAATLHGDFASVTGTSFAAPVVTARFAGLVSTPNSAAVDLAWAALERAAIDLGAPGRDPIFGYGYLTAPLAAATPGQQISERNHAAPPAKSP